MDHSNQFKQFNIAHQHKNRLRIIAHCLIKDGERALILRILLLKREAIKDVKIVPDIGSVTIRYDAAQLPTANLLMLLEAILTNVGLKPKQVIDALGIKKTALQGSAKTINFAIQGMSCSSCALYIEMMLKRDPKVSHAAVNFITETASVTGTLSKKELFALINANGYQAVS
ncbi:MAG: cation transporter, partial [Methylicorpusculum sp.]|nr:cation transporter [Methylicorpusculum sp.]